MAEIHRTAIDAWQHLVQHGGLELDDRDRDFEESLKSALDPQASNLEEALTTASVDAFCRAFFQLTLPYLDMLREILALFRRAGAREGQQQWNLKVGELDVGLEDFEDWIATWENVDHTFLYPAVDWRGAWDIVSVLARRPSADSDTRWSASVESAPASIQAWLRRYDDGFFDPLPIHLRPGICPPGLEVAAQVAQVGLSQLSNLDRKQLNEHRYRNSWDFDRGDALFIGSLAQNETDFWLRQLVVPMAFIAEEGDGESVQSALEEIAARYPKRAHLQSLPLKMLEKILSLPIWQRRHEFYSVWIGCEIVKDMDGHEIDLHHDNGRMAFGFSEMLLASVRTSRVPVAVYAERRTSVSFVPRGAGRTSAVQPDYSLWEVDRAETCKLAIEVKHYKRSGGKKFAEPLEDYARAHSEAEVLLVTHGPAGQAWAEIDKAVRNRCHVIGRLRPANLKAREELRQKVRECVGEPEAPWSSRRDASVVIAIDISGSMRELLKRESTRELLRDLARQHGAGKLAAVDTEIRDECQATEAAYERLLGSRGGSTSLKQPMAELLTRYDKILLITDHDGLAQAQALPFGALLIHDSDVKVVSVETER